MRRILSDLKKAHLESIPFSSRLTIVFQMIFGFFGKQGFRQTRSVSAPITTE